MTAIEIAAIAAAMKSLAKELGVSVDLNQLASRIGLSRSAGLLGVLPMAGGVGVGFALGVLFAPRAGRETRERLSQSTSRMLERLRDMRGAAAAATESEMLNQPAGEKQGKGASASGEEGRWTGAAE